MKKILILAYQISPTRGSEYSVAWNYVTEMSKDNELVVLYGASGNHMGDFESFEEHINSNIHFVAIKPNFIANSINILNKKKIFPYAFYLAYRIWQMQAYKLASKLVEDEHFDLIHFLNPIGYREPGYLWKIDIPYIWGPIGGVPNRPKQLFNALSLKNRLLFTLRNWANIFQFNYNRRFKKALDATDLLLTATSENKFLIKKKFKKSSIYLPENGIVNLKESIIQRTIQLKKGDLCNLLWIGSIDARKALNILIEALSNLKLENWQLNVIGDGSLMTSIQQLAVERHILNKITWHGHIPRNDVFKLLQTSHLHIITSLGEGNPTTIWETMANGIPTITLNHCGMKDVICEKCGVKIDISSYNQVVYDLANVLSDLISNPHKINELSKGVNECARNYTWEKRRELFNQFYQIAIENWQQKRLK